MYRDAASGYFPAGVTSVCSPSTDKVPHFSRLGDVEVNAGQNASFQCVATGKVSESEPFLLEVRTRRLFLSPPLKWREEEEWSVRGLSVLFPPKKTREKTVVLA